MKKVIKKTLLGFGAGVGIFIIILIIGIIFFLLMPTNERDNRNSTKQAEMVTLTLEWSRLAPFPKEADNFSIRTEGSALTRTFKGSFSCPKNILESWVKDSPGLQDAKIENISEKKKKYIISPSGGAAYAEVIIDYETNKVEFKAYWS